MKCTSDSGLILPEKVDIPEFLHLTLEGVKSVSLSWIGAAVAFLQGTSRNEFGKKLQDIQLHKMRLFGDLSGAGLNTIFSWTEDPQHLDVAISVASCALFGCLWDILVPGIPQGQLWHFMAILDHPDSLFTLINS